MEPEDKKRHLEEYLIERIKKSGYPLEIRISDLLDEDHYVSNTQYYFDEHEKQGRDIDIYAIPIYSELDKKLVDFEKKLTPFRVSTHLAIECKKSETHAWVFYTRPNIKLSGYHVSGQFKTSIPKLKAFSANSFEWLLQTCLTFHYHEFERVAVAYDEIKKQKFEKKITSGKNKSRREIFEAINQLVKFTCYETHQIFNRISNSPKSTAYDDIVVFFFPIVVFDGDMFEVTFDSGEPKIERKNHMILETKYRCPTCKEVETFMLDVVHASYFSKFMKILRTDCTELKENMLKKHDELIQSAKENRQKHESLTKYRTSG